MNIPFYALENCLHAENTRLRHQSPVWPNSRGSPSTVDPRLTELNTFDAEDWCNNSPIEDIEIPKQHTSIELSGVDNTTSDIWTLDNPAFAALKSVVPTSIADEMLPGNSVMSSATQIFASPLLRSIYFSLGNNSAGLSALHIKDVITFLQREKNEWLYQLILSSPGYSSRAIAQNIFKGAIEVGDGRIVDLLLNEKAAEIDANQLFCFVEGVKYTPIERASLLRHKGVIESLLRHRAYVNRTHPECRNSHGNGPNGAPDFAIGMAREYTRVDPQIFQMLLEAGGDLSLSPMYRLIYARDGEFVRLIMSANARRNVTKWSHWGTFSQAIGLLDHQISMDIVEIMLSVNVDLNYHVKNHGISNHPRGVLDAAAQRGSLEIVKVLLEKGASLTGDTLPCAVARGSEDLVRFLLDKKADINSTGSRGETPLAAAIRLRNPQIINLLEGYGALNKLNDQAYFSEALKAASEVGDVEFIKNWVHLGDNISPRELGYALRIATRDGRDEVATRLIDAGAYINICYESSPGDGPPLLEALKRRNAALVYRLLEVDANPNWGLHWRDFSGKRPTAIQLAAEWGDHAVVEALISAGADINDCGSNTALTIAVKHKDIELVELLLRAGADINNSRTRLYGGTALEAAAGIGDLDMVRLLFDLGADPDDSFADRKASQENGELLKLLFERHCARYPIVRRIFASQLLALAIKMGNEPIFLMMLGRGVKADAMIRMDGQMATPLGHAIFKEQKSVVGFAELLLLSGYDLNSIVAQAGLEDWEGNAPPRITALLAAIGTRNVSTVKLVMEYGADVNFPACHLVKRAPLQRAAELVLSKSSSSSSITVPTSTPRLLKEGAVQPFSLQLSEVILSLLSCFSMTRLT